MRAAVDSLTGQVSMYRLATLSLIAVLVMGVILGFVGIIGYDGYAILGTAGVVIVATLGSNEIAARLARVVPHRESSVITALIIVCLVPPALGTMQLFGVAVASVAASLSKYLIVWRGRHIVNPAAAGVLVAGLLQLTIGIWWIATPAMLPVVALGAILLLDRTRRADIGIIFIAITTAIIGTRTLLMGAQPWDAYSSILQLYPVVFFAGFMLSEPQTLPPRRWQQWLTAAVAALVFSVPFQWGILYTTPELALVVANLVAFAVSRRGGAHLRVTQSRALSESAREYRFEPSRPLRFEAGQYLELHLPHRADRRGTRRIFTIASAPESSEVTLGMRTPQEGSSFKRELASLEPGSRVQVTQVSGDFVLPRNAAQPLVFVAGGIGITPFASQLASMTARGEERDIVLIVASSNPGEVLYREVLEASSARLVFIGANPPDDLGDRWTVIAGEPSSEAMQTAVSDLAGRRGYVSGAPAVVAAARSALRRAGVRRVTTDYFSGY